MPHDINGKVLSEGDHVVVPCVVTKIYETEDGRYCNVSLDTEKPMPPYDSPTNITLNTRQVQLVE